jgi:hypothetical protein
LSARALSVTAMVADGLMRAVRSARKAIPLSSVVALFPKAPRPERQGRAAPQGSILR